MMAVVAAATPWSLEAGRGRGPGQARCRQLLYAALAGTGLNALLPRARAGAAAPRRSSVGLGCGGANWLCATPALQPSGVGGAHRPPGGQAPVSPPALSLSPPRIAPPAAFPCAHGPQLSFPWRGAQPAKPRRAQWVKAPIYAAAAVSKNPFTLRGSTPAPREPSCRLRNAPLPQESPREKNPILLKAARLAASPRVASGC
jgi:hypothetical protein